MRISISRCSIGRFITPVLLSLLAATPSSAGGSNIVVWQVDQTCSSNYGVIKNYNNPTVENIVNTALTRMRQNGQVQLRVMVLFAHGGTGDNTTLDSTGGTLNGQQATNFQNLIHEIHTLGFSQVQFTFGPQSSYNDPDTWPSWQETNYQENWNLIAHVVNWVMDAPPNGEGMINSGFDLWNEAFPTNAMPCANST